MDTLPVNEFRRQVGEYLNQTYYAGKAFALVKGEKQVAALVPMAMVERLAQLELIHNAFGEVGQPTEEIKSSQ